MTGQETPQPSVGPAGSPGELNYYRSIGEDGRHHALNKPFSDPDVGLQLMQVGAVVSLLPPPPADVLECGCGSGWLSKLLAKVGYRTTGVDIAPHAIDLASTQSLYESVPLPRFIVSPGEALPFVDEFDAVVYYDALHHSVDERLAIAAAHRALRPGGVLVTSEPGRGHHEASQSTIHQFGVTERDMPARHIVTVARDAGFAEVSILPRADEYGQLMFGQPPSARLKRAIRASISGRAALAVRRTLWTRLDNGIVIARK
jgi:SAM-dependent methyltransferase